MLKLGSPDIRGFYDMLYGTAGMDLQSLSWLPILASGIVFSGNPPYYLEDFLAWYPKFFGPPTSISGLTITIDSDTITGFSAEDIDTFSPGLMVMDNGGDCILPNSFVISVSKSGRSIQLNQAAFDNGTDLKIFVAPTMPLIVMQSYATLAAASVMQARYCEAWSYAMALFIAHYSTMYLRSENLPADADISQIAGSGMAKGILVHRAAGDVSATSQLIQGYEQWGTWAYTVYGEQFITIARATNMGPVWVP